MARQHVRSCVREDLPRNEVRNWIKATSREVSRFALRVCEFLDEKR
jgi:hypothetical protein